MRRDQDRNAGASELVDEAPELAARQRIDSTSRFVEKHDRRLVEDRAPESQTLPPAPRQRARQRVLPATKAGHVERKRAPRREARACEAVDAAEERDVLIDREPLVQREALRHVADSALDALRITAHVESAHHCGPRRRLQQAAEHADRRGFSGAVAAKEPEDLACPYVERHVIDGQIAAKPPAQMSYLHRRRVRAILLGFHRPVALARRASARRTPARARVRSSWA